MNAFAEPKRTSINYSTGIEDTSKIGFGFHEKQGVLAHIGVFALRAGETVLCISCVNMLLNRKHKITGEPQFYPFTDDARQSLDRYVQLKRKRTLNAPVRS